MQATELPIRGIALSVKEIYDYLAAAVQPQVPKPREPTPRS